MHTKKIDKINDTKIIEELKTFPNQAIIWGLVHQNDPNMWELPSGESIMIMEPHIDDPFVFVAGEVSAQDIDEIIKICPTDYPRNNIYHSDFLKKGWDFHLRAELSYLETSKTVQLDQGWEFKKIDDIELFKQCYWYEKYIKQYDSHELFFKSKNVYVLCNNNIVISEGYIDHHISSPYAEISVATNQSYRGQGAGTKMASYLAEKCKEQELVAIWTCQIDNRASLNTALRAGFKINRYYINMVPEVGNTMSPKLEKWIVDNTPIDWDQ
jgi:RimJ/RimL family protein N-acetyltransferase